MNPLFQNAARAFQQAARGEFLATQAGQIVSRLEKLKKRSVRGGRTGSKIRSAERDLKRLGKPDVLKQLLRTKAGSYAQTAMRYAKGGGSALDYALSFLGPMGSIFKSLLRPAGREMSGATVESELEAAANLLKAFGWDVKSPSDVATERRSERRRERAPLQGVAGDPLRSIGIKVEDEPPPGFDERTYRVPERRAQEDGNVVMVGGRRRVWKDNDPILTGEMIPVVSSNVHSIGYLFNANDPMNGTLQVRFLQTRRGTKSKMPGPLYHYYRIHPDVFEAFKTATSKGVFVWDRLRIRGTVSGHRVHYKLKGITGGYVPRKATRYGQNEYYIGRQVRGRSTSTGETRTFESQLPDRFVNRARPEPPNRGFPNRGVNGAPNRGR